MADPYFVHNGLTLPVSGSFARARDLFEFYIWIFMLVDAFFNFKTFMLVELYDSVYHANTK